MPGLVKMSYKNVSGSAIPAYGFVQPVGTCETTPTGDIVFEVTTPGDGDGPYLIDDGKGSEASGAGVYGNCYRLFEGCSWVAFAGGTPTPWAEVGPQDGSFLASSSGSGFYFAGQFDATNGRGLIIAKSGTGIPRVHFRIDYIDYGYTDTATCTILDVSCGGDPPGLNYDGSITVIDVALCYFNEINPSDGYVGRHGFADYMRPYPDPDEVGCRWVVSALCCPPE